MYITELIPKFDFDVKDVGKCHVIVSNCFERECRYQFYRDGKRFLVFSPEPPSRIVDMNMQTKPYSPKIDNGFEIPFRIKANPVKTAIVFDGPKRKTKFVPLSGKDLKTWLSTALENAGCDLVNVNVTETGVERGIHRPGAPKMTFNSVLFDGVLKVKDKGRLVAALESGIGRGKAYGFGMLMLGKW